MHWLLLFMLGCALLFLACLWGLAQQCLPPPTEEWTAHQQRHTVEAMQRAAHERRAPKC